MNGLLWRMDDKGIESNVTRAAERYRVRTAHTHNVVLVNAGEAAALPEFVGGVEVRGDAHVLPGYVMLTEARDVSEKVVVK